jgi:hypothetical protein
VGREMGFFLAVLGFELRVSLFARQALYPLIHSTSSFFFDELKKKIKSWKENRVWKRY